MIAPGTAFFLAFLPALALAVREWVAYFCVASQIRAQARLEGHDWPFLSDPRYVIRLLFVPDELIEEGDSIAMRAAKDRLLALRGRLWKIVSLALALALTGFFLAVVYGIVAPLVMEHE